MTPIAGPLAGGSHLTIHGTGFTKVTRVRFGSVTELALKVKSTTLLTVTSPRHVVGTVAITVVTSHGSSAATKTARFRYAAVPAVTKLSVRSGPSTGARSVTVTGRNFTRATKVSFGTVAGRTLKVKSASTLTVTTPAHTLGLVDVRVTTPGGTSPRSAADHYTFVKPAPMNFSQIAQGDYRTLLGRWVEAAHCGSGLGGSGFQCYPAGIDGGIDILSVTASKIVNGSIVVRGKSLSDGQGLVNAKLVFTNNGKYLTGLLADESVARNYAVYFYPRGVVAHLGLTNGVKVPSSANRIVIWTSNNSYTEVFSQK